MQKAAIGVSLALGIMGTIYLSLDLSSEDTLPEGSAIDSPEEDRSSSVNSPDIQAEEAIWQKLGDRLAGRMASSGSDELPLSPPDEASEPVFDTRADWLAAAGVTAEDDAEARQWAFDRGFETHSLGYEFYDHETLKSLADAGDIFAIQRLAEHAAWKEGQLEKAAVLYREAAVRGSVVAVDRMAGNEVAMAQRANVSDRRDSTKRHLINALAWTAVLRRRVGDLPMPGLREDFILSQLERFEVTLNEADLNSIDVQSQALFQDLMQTRAELGFDEFDNSVPILYEKLKRHGLENAAIRNP